MRWEVSGIPEGKSGRFSIQIIEHQRVDTEPTAPFSWQTYSKYANIPDGTYTVLFEAYGEKQAKLNIMQDTERECEEHKWVTERSGSVLIGGLGIGMINIPLLASDDITSVTIIEKEQDVIDLVWEHCAKDDRFTLIHADIDTWEVPEGSYWDFAWFDTWLTHEEPIEEYIQRMFERYGDFVGDINGWNWPYIPVKDDSIQEP